MTLDGAIFDLGGHSFHTPHPAIRQLVFDALEMEEQNRDAWCWLNGEWVRYPFQQHFSELADSDSRHACQIGLDAAGGGQDAANFDEYLDRRFGRGITELFMRPYNRKLWGADLTRLDEKQFIVCADRCCDVHHQRRLFTRKSPLLRRSPNSNRLC